MEQAGAALGRLQRIESLVGLQESLLQQQGGVLHIPSPQQEVPQRPARCCLQAYIPEPLSESECLVERASCLGVLVQAKHQERTQLDQCPHRIGAWLLREQGHGLLQRGTCGADLFQPPIGATQTERCPPCCSAVTCSQPPVQSRLKRANGVLWSGSQQRCLA